MTIIKVTDMSWNTDDDFEIKYLGTSEVTHIITIGFWDLIKMAFSINNNVLKLETPSKLTIRNSICDVGFIRVDSTLKIKRGS